MKEDLENAIFDAWKRIRPRLEADPAELAKRLARRKLMSLRRPPRVWCLAIRAGDTRLAEWAGEVEGEPREGQLIYVDAEMLRALCEPVRIAWPGQPAVDVAAKLGVTVGCLHTVRCKGIFRTTFIKGLDGKRGPAVPILFSTKLLDPGAKQFVRPDGLWGWAAWYLLDRIPHDFGQMIKRVPYYRPNCSSKLYDEFRHPEVDAVRAKRRPAGTPQHLPRWDGTDPAC